MIEGALQILSILSIGFIVLLLCSFFSAGIYPLFRGSIERSHPATRSLILIFYSLAPVAVAVAVVALLFFPEASRLLVPEHCHNGVCGSHAPVMHLSTVGGATLVAASSFAIFGLVIAAASGVRAMRRRIGLLLGVASQGQRPDYLVVDSPALFAWCCGIWRTNILVSKGLESQLSTEQLSMVLAHEHAHARRMDNLRGLLVRYVTTFWPTGRRRRLNAELASDFEMACDLEAAEVVGNRREYAGVLRYMSSQQPPLPGQGAAFACQKIDDRIRAITTGPSVYQPVHYGAAMLLFVWLLQIVVTTGLSHYLIEWISIPGA